MNHEKPNTQPLIDSVPGVTRVEPAIETPVHRQAITIPEGEFRGDPRRVIGHPSNPNGEMMQALAEQNSMNRDSVALEVGKHAVGPTVITEVPKNNL